jgi:hypothetical protein
MEMRERKLQSNCRDEIIKYGDKGTRQHKGRKRDKK